MAAEDDPKECRGVVSRKGLVTIGTKAAWGLCRRSMSTTQTPRWHRMHHAALRGLYGSLLSYAYFLSEPRSPDPMIPPSRQCDACELSAIMRWLWAVIFTTVMMVAVLRVVVAMLVLVVAQDDDDDDDDDVMMMLRMVLWISETLLSSETGNWPTSWAGLGWAGLGWLGWAGLGWAGLGWAGL